MASHHTGTGHQCPPGANHELCRHTDGVTPHRRRPSMPTGWVAHQLQGVQPPHACCATPSSDCASNTVRALQRWPVLLPVRYTSLSSSQASLATNLLQRWPVLLPVRRASLSSSQASLPTNLFQRWPVLLHVRGAFFRQGLHSRRSLRFAPLFHLKLFHACDQWHSSRVFTASYRLTL
jgi:hypothetical protein